MHDLRAWSDTHALGLFAVLVLLGLGGAWWLWQRRPLLEDDAPVPMLRKRTALFVLIAGAIVFALLAAAVMGEGRLVALDTRVTALMRETFGDGLLRVLAAVTQLGNDQFLVWFGIAVAMALVLRKHLLLAALWVFTTVGNGLLIRLLKEQFSRTRPVHDHGFALETGFSFPSGHAAGSLVFYGMLAYVLLVLVPARWHRGIATASALLVLIIGASRVLLQVHYLSDVCAGYALGLGWLALCVSVGESLRTARRRHAGA